VCLDSLAFGFCGGPTLAALDRPGEVCDRDDEEGVAAKVKSLIFLSYSVEERGEEIERRRLRKKFSLREQRTYHLQYRPMHYTKP
jgi:hypothetical protein